MATKARLKFYNLSFEKERKLVGEGGFVVFSRKKADDSGPAWVVMEKLVKTQSMNFEVLYGGKLPPDIQLHLTRRCDKVVNVFMDPDAHQGEIRARLDRIASTLPKYQAAFIREWIKENVDDVPWKAETQPTFLKRSNLV